MITTIKELKSNQLTPQTFNIDREWVDYVWNFIDINNDLSCRENKKDFEPIFSHSSFKEKLPEKPSKILVNPYCDIIFWKKKWISLCLKMIKKNPKHTFIFFSNGEIYTNYKFPGNCWLGVKITENNDFSKYDFRTLKGNNIKFYLIEPKEYICTSCIGPYCDWIILDAGTKIIPEYIWICNIIKHCLHFNIPIYMEKKLKNIWHKRLIHEYPLGVEEVEKEIKKSVGWIQDDIYGWDPFVSYWRDGKKIKLEKALICR